MTGKANSEAGERKREAELKEGKVDGEAISFVEMLNIQGNEIRIAYTGKLSANGSEIKFTREVGDFAKTEIVAKREQAASAATGALAAKTIRIKAGKMSRSSRRLQVGSSAAGWPIRASRAAKPSNGPISRLPTRRVPTSTGRNATAWTPFRGRCPTGSTW